MNVAVVNLGCKVNRVESDSIALSYRSKGAHLVSPTEADLIVVNTCTVTGDAEKKTRKTIRKLLRGNDHAAVLVTGCAAVIDPSFFSSLDDRVVVVDKSDLIDSTDMSLRLGEEFPTRVAVKVQDGCDHACSYCIVHVARGPAWSRPFDDVLDEVGGLSDRGVGEIVLTGIDMGSYTSGGKGLVDLLEALLERTDGARLRLSSVEPRSLDPRMVDLMAKSEGRICRHLHLPLQSGSDKVLREMYRPYRSGDFRALCTMLKEEIPSLSLTTDVIVGFPGETQADFDSTCELVEEVGFSKLHVFRYSPRRGTPAAKRLDQIEPSIKDERADVLIRLGEDLRLRFARGLVGSSEWVVVEGRGRATTESYYKVDVPLDYEVGSLVRIALTDVDPSGIFKA